jgi:glycosyltransferase involved in cell wall biosynthesis
MAIIFMAAYTHYRRDPRVRREAEALVQEGHEVVFLARRHPGESAREEVEGVTVVTAPALRNKPDSMAAYLVDYLAFFTAIQLHLFRHPWRYRLVHINNMPDFLVLAAWLPRLLGRPVIHDVHDLMPELYAEKFTGSLRWLARAIALQERLAGRFASAVLTVEEGVRSRLSQRGIPTNKIHVLMNLPDERVFVPGRAQAGRSDGRAFVVVYHGTLAHRLGLDIAIRAVASVRHLIPAIEFRIIGAGEERERLIALRDRLDAGQIVTFSDGFVPVERIPSLVDDADLAVLPLRASAATDVMLPTKLLEYVTLGIPCVVPRTTTITRYFDDTMLQFFEAGSVEGLASAIVELHRQPARRRSLAENASRSFGQRYKWSEHKRVYTRLVASLLGASDGGASGHAADETGVGGRRQVRATPTGRGAPRHP